MNEDRPASDWDRIRVRLIKREADVNRLVRRLATIETWSKATVELASAIGVAQDRIEASRIFAYTLVEKLGYDRARILWNEEEFRYPNEPSQGDYVTQHCVIASEANPGDKVDVYAEHTKARAAYLEGDTALQLTSLCALLRFPLDGVRLRSALLAERDSLQRRVDEATQELREALVRADAARTIAEQATRARTQFLAHMSHEIRTPMTAILGHADLVRVAASDRDCRRVLQSVEVIRGSGSHLLQLLNDILELARVESGHVGLELAPACIEDLLHEVESLMRVRATAAGLALRFITQADMPVANLDLPRLRQILINLLGNAIKFTRQGGVDVRSYWTSQGDSVRFRIEVEDSGLGIAPGALDSIFDEFRMSHGQSGGTGLGLAICRRLVHLMGGTIEVRSEVGVGSCFAIEFLATPATRIVTPPSRSAPAMQFAGTALLAEDTAALAAIYENWLKSLGFSVARAADGAEACAALESQVGTFDVVLLDMQMPIVDGYATATRARSMRPSLPVIALTAHAMPGERERCLKSGCHDYLAKPFSRDALVETLQRHVRPLIRRGRTSTIANVDQLVADMMNEFLADLRLREAEIERGLVGDAALVTRAAHQIAGMSATFGFPELTQRARDVEESARLMERDKLRPRVDALLQEIQLAFAGRRAPTSQ